ncbi:MAG: hypothetical protein JST29_03420 [Bacteroidetes bacterium]|nr:hypothetical protein [Bacteroidota bacterium]MBS1590754.1 hypothetical protein [Bacteroidota bacterium]
MSFLKKYISIFLGLFMLVYYILIAWIIHRTGYEHSEALFHAEKIKLLFEADENTLLTIGTTFPSIVFLSSVVFTPFGYPFAPVLASIVFTSLLFYMLVNDFSKSNLPRRVFLPMLLLLFIFHPGILYAAASGRGVAAIMLFFYLVFRSLFRYYQTQTSFYLSMASIYLTCLVFCDFNFIWLLFAFFPFIFLVSLDGLKINREQPPIIQYFETLNNRSQRRKLVNRTVAIYIIIFLLPFGALFLFRTLNYYHAGDATYFLTSQYANWHVTGSESIGSLIASKYIDHMVIEQHQMIYQVYVLLLTPLLILVFFLYKGNLYELFTVLAPFILMAVVLIDVQKYITIEYYLIFLVLALISLCYYAGKKYKSKILYPIIMAVALLNIFTGIYYFKKTVDREEVSFFATLKNVKQWKEERANSEEYVLAAYISDITDETHKILMDDAAAYKVMAHLRSLKPVIMPVNNNFITIAENPKAGARFLCVAKDNNLLKSFTVLNEYNRTLMENRRQLSTKLMFETKNWAIYKVLND